MNKTAIRLFVFLLLILFVSLSAYSMDWEIHENVDLFGDSTGEYYISLPSQNTGFYSTEYSQNVEFKWDCSFDEQGHLSLYFFENNGRSLIPLTGDSNSELSIKFQDGTVKQYSVEINTTHYKKNEIITKESIIKDIKDTGEIKLVFREGFSVYNLGRLRTENISEALSNIKNYADILALLSDGYILAAYVSSFSIEGIDCSKIQNECRIRIRNKLEENIESKDFESFFDTVYNLKTSYPDLYYKLSLKTETEEVINKYFASPILDYVDDNAFENAERLISQLESICHDPEEMEKINSIKFNVILSETLHSIKTSFFGNNASFHKAYSYLLNPNIYSVEVENRDKGCIFVYSDKDSQDYPFYLLIILDNTGTIKYINKLSLNPGHQNSDYLKVYIGLNSNDSTAYINSEYHEISKQLETIFDGYKILKGPSSYKLGLGIVYADSSSTTQAAYSATVAAVVVDENGVIVDCKIDCAQNKMNGDAVDPEKTFKSKYELGYDYNMVKFSEATNEWFQQADAFASYVIGKTGEEVANLPTRVRGWNEPHPGYVVTTDETLFASCSISVPDFMEAVAKAAADPYAQEFETKDSFKLGVACNSTAEDSTAPADGKNGTIKMYVEFAAAAVDGEGKILATVTDAIQPTHEVDEFGEIVKNTYKGTKKELGFDYNMVKFSEATNEWFQQAAAFEDYCEGKTADEVLSLPTRVRGADEPHPGYVVTADEALFASCSISIPGFQSVIAKAANNAR